MPFCLNCFNTIPQVFWSTLTRQHHRVAVELLAVGYVCYTLKNNIICLVTAILHCKATVLNAVHFLCMTSRSGLTTGSHTALYQLFIFYLAEEHSTHSSMSSSRLKSTFSNGSKEDEKRVLWRCCPLRNTRKCNQQWPMLDSSNPREFVNIPILAQGRYARNTGTSTWQQQMNY